MLFNSFEFFLFLPVVFILYWFVFNKSLKLQNALLFVASYFFYAWWSWKFLGLLLLSTLIDYSFGFWIANSIGDRRKMFLWLSIFNNLLVLGIFKYFNFFSIELQSLLSLLHIQVSPVLLDVILPVGISFYTFHGMSYVIDIYRRQFEPVKSFLDYSVFVCFFPLLVAGPIERAAHLLPQVQQKRTFNYKQAIEGGRLILWGLFKKVIIADTLARTVNEVYGNYAIHSGTTLALAAIFFSFQIYCDFSGYSDIALGTAKLFGFELLTNFRFPYFSRNVGEFWKRWHISLSSWFRDYVYIPLGGSRQGKWKAIRNVFIIFLISGFWHGASMNFITWGFLHACGFIPLMLIGNNRKHVDDTVAMKRSLPNYQELVQMLSTFAFVTFAWIFFRITDFNESLNFIKSMFINTQHPGEFMNYITGLYYIIPLILIDWHFRRDERKLKINIGNKYIRLALYSFIAILVIQFMINAKLNHQETSFIYFRF